MLIERHEHRLVYIRTQDGWFLYSLFREREKRSARDGKSMHEVLQTIEKGDLREQDATVIFLSLFLLTRGFFFFQRSDEEKRMIPLSHGWMALFSPLSLESDG